MAIGLTLPRAAVEILRQRVTPACFNRALLLAEPFAPGEALAAGMLDAVVPARELTDAARTMAGRLGGLDFAAYAATKRRARQLSALRTAIEADFTEFAAGG